MSKKQKVKKEINGVMYVSLYNVRLWMQKNLRMKDLIGVWQAEEEYKFAYNAFEVVVGVDDIQLQDLILEFKSGPNIQLSISEFASATIIGDNHE